MTRNVQRLSIYLLSGVAMAGVGHAQGLADPMRPPEFISAPGGAGAETGPVLQQILVSGSRKIAVIGGREVALGQKYGDARLVRIGDAEVVLRKNGETTVLKLYPAVEKSASKSAKAPARRARQERQK